jgi:hypothetical protein
LETAFLGMFHVLFRRVLIPGVSIEHETPMFCLECSAWDVLLETRLFRIDDLLWLRGGAAKDPCAADAEK